MKTGLDCVLRGSTLTTAPPGAGPGLAIGGGLRSMPPLFSLKLTTSCFKLSDLWPKDSTREVGNLNEQTNTFKVRNRLNASHDYAELLMGPSRASSCAPSQLRTSNVGVGMPNASAGLVLGPASGASSHHPWHRNCVGCR